MTVQDMKEALLAQARAEIVVVGEPEFDLDVVRPDGTRTYRHRLIVTDAVGQRYCYLATTEEPLGAEQ